MGYRLEPVYHLCYHWALLFEGSRRRTENQFSFSCRVPDVKTPERKVR
jgi:hypothetical protein